MTAPGTARLPAWLVLLALSTIAAPTAAAPHPTAAHKARVPEPFVALEDVAPHVVQEIRYASGDNFTGLPVPGYEAGRCWLTRPTAKALAKVQQALETYSLGLKVFDCYRPQRAVAHFLRWSQSGASAESSDGSKRPQAADREDATRHDYLPRVRREDVFRLGYLSSRSGHSRGITVDLTLVPLDTKANPARDKRPACNAPSEGKLRDGELDLGTGFDCLDPTAHTGNPNLSPQARAHRMLLAQVMREAGFVGYPLEWWHFTLARPGPGQSHYDFPIR